MAIKLSPPWDIWYKKVQALFEYDSEVHVIFDQDKPELTLYVDDDEKAEALSSLLPEVKEFGNVKLPVIIVPANKATLEECESSNVYEAAFKGNGAIAAIKEVDFFGRTLTYIIFRKKIVQYYTDNLSDYFGNCSTLYQDIAKDVFEPDDGVFFCTDIEDPVLEDTAVEKCWP